MTEIPALTRLINEYSPEKDFRVVLIAVADRPAKVQTFAPSLAPRVLYDPQWEVAHRYGTEQVPETYIVVGGKVIERFPGSVDWDDARVRQRLRDLLAEQRRG
jgi:hypothetical protein